MVRLTTERDVERLRQAALLLEAENRRLTSRVLELTRQLLTAKGEAAEVLQLRLVELERQLSQARDSLYGPSSEKRPRPSAAPVPAPAEANSPRGHGPRQQALPVEEVVHLLDVADQQCPQCGGALSAMTGQYEEAEEVDVVERRFVLKRHRRQKYRCGCGGCVETALGPPKLQPGGRYSLDFALEVAVQKYLEHAPLERQVRAMAREGLAVDSQTLWDQVLRLSRLLLPTWEALWLSQLRRRVLGADETRWPLLGSPGQTKWHLWALASAHAVVYRVADTRGAEAARELLKDFSGVLVTDGYAVYAAVAKQRAGGFRVAHCWAHVRRKFLECGGPEAEVAVRLIGELYQVEREYQTSPPDVGRLHALRQERSRPVVSRLHAWALQVRALPESALGKALGYLGNLWPGLTRFLDDALIPLDNNATERALRGPVVGRKNHYGSRSRRGTEVAAILYSLLESAKRCGVEPKAYLRAAVLAALNGEPPLLPHLHAAT
ncbi:IS66 family transposase [Corallococcus sp. ZKHCc1 1396]|uniref:IS66 family transposase n=3 Tax=Corallococcus soli TaxID=2710757 RepID=A0ABR9PLT7_9BACT|nr:IS66 family transposase [Corallococcus soli]MBE4748844.1 IS66 family transposase [Corallococcus soli]